jgi:ferric-dicitrate binding protein FerR (iron transport regulator)
VTARKERADLVAVPEDSPEHAEAVKEMYELHVAVGRAALTKALAAINLMEPADIPINVAVQLLKFGADLERRALLGIEPDGEDDPFGTLAGRLGA